MQKYILDKGFGYKFFMLIAFLMFTMVMYQGHIQNKDIYSLLFFAGIALCSFQIATVIYVILVKRSIELTINNEKISWKIFDNSKLYKDKFVQRDQIKDVKTEINYLTGNIYANFQVIFILNDDSEVILTDGLIYDFGLKKAEELSKFLLDNEIGNKQDVKFAKLIKQLHIDSNKKDSKFTKRDGKSYYQGFFSKNKKDFLSLRLQIEARYPDYKIIKTNSNNAYKITSDSKNDSFIYLRSNVIGYFVEYYNLPKNEDLKSLKELGHKKKIGF